MSFDAPAPGHGTRACASRSRSTLLYGSSRGVTIARTLLKTLETSGTADELLATLDSVHLADKAVEQRMRLWLSAFAVVVLFVLANLLVLAVHPGPRVVASLPLLILLAAATYSVSAYYRDLDVEDRKIATVRTLLRLLREDLRGEVQAAMDFRTIDQRRFATRREGNLFAAVRQTCYEQKWLRLTGTLGGRVRFALEVTARMARQTITNPRSRHRVVTLREGVRLELEGEHDLTGLRLERLPEGLFERWTSGWASDRTLVLAGETAPRVEHRRHGLRELIGRDALVDFENLLALLGLGLAALRQLRVA